jgi:ATP-dependent RNA helicase RhlE
MTQDSTTTTFHGLGIDPAVLKVIDGLEYTVPTPVQQAAIPPAIEGKDILGIAQTGTGKTLAFGIPMIQLLLKGPGRALILVPTRELALQVDATLRKLGNPFDIRSVIVIGGMMMDMQVKLLRKETIRVVIATPGRLMEHLEQKTFDASVLKMVVLDEADRMLDMGFAPQVQRIAKFLPEERQTLFFSATMPGAVVKLAGLYMKDPVRVEVAPSGAAPEKIVQEMFIVREEDKRELLGGVLSEYKGSVLVFMRTKMGVMKLTEALRQMGFTANELHSDRTQGQRRHALEGFKKGTYRILVATDIAARGIDVKGIELVVNYDLPDENENYVHRIGRTGRAGMAGRAITFATTREGHQIREIETLMKTSLKIITRPGYTTMKFAPLKETEAPMKKKHTYDPAKHAAGRPQFQPPPQAPTRPKFIKPKNKS